MRILLLPLALALLAGCERPAPAPGTPAAAASAARGTVTEIATPAGAESGRARLSLAPDGTPLLSWTEPDGDGDALLYSLWRGGAWSAPQTAARGDDWMINWADTPGVVPLAGGQLLAHTLPGASGHAYDAAASLWRDGAWTEAALLNDDGLEAEHGFVSVAPLADGGAGVAWLDGREQARGGHHAGAMQLRFAALGASGERSGETILDAKTCDCCPTAMAATASGPVVAYRDRSDAEIRDVAVVRRVDGAWTEPVVPHADGWHIEGCPVNGPALDARGERVALAWFTAAGDSARVRLTFSDDAGATWGPAFLISDDAPLGRVGVAMLADGSAAVSWLGTSGDGAVLLVRRVSASGATSPAVEVARMAGSRDSGIPRVVASGDGVLAAWTDASAGTLLRTARVHL